MGGPWHPDNRGLSKLPEYRIWLQMRSRCCNPNYTHFSYYGGRGITIFSEWLRSFGSFFAHIGPRPTSKHTLDRIDSDGNYEPGNVRWATRKEQTRNRRCTRYATINGITKTWVEWSESEGIHFKTIIARIEILGWSPERAILTPHQGRRWRPATTAEQELEILRLWASGQKKYEIAANLGVKWKAVHRVVGAGG